MERIYVFSSKPLPKSQVVETEAGLWNGCYRNTLFLKARRSDDYKNALELIYEAVVRYIADVGANDKDCAEQVAERDFCRRLSAYLRLTGSKLKIKRRISKVLAEGDIINIEGFVKFRLKDMSGDIAAFFDLLFYRCSVQRRYESFICLVRDYVDGQPAKAPLVHIVFGNGFELYDANNRSLTESNGLFPDWELPAENPNDYLISSLLHYMPERIIFHRNRSARESAANSNPIILTISSVFKGRAETCTDARCLFCGMNVGAELSGERH